MSALEGRRVALSVIAGMAFVAAAIFGSDGWTEPAAGRGAVVFNEHMIVGLSEPLNVADVDAVFWHVFSQLKSDVRVYPTENYYYFIVYAGGRQLWGNFRLAPGDRDRGFLHFAYFEYNDDPQHPDDFFTKYKRYGPADGVTVTRRDERTYAVRFRDRVVTFHLNHLDQKPPRTARLRPDETFVMRTWDESGFQFFLVFDRARAHFLWILNGGDRSRQSAAAQRRSPHRSSQRIRLLRRRAAEPENPRRGARAERQTEQLLRRTIRSARRQLRVGRRAEQVHSGGVSLYPGPRRRVRRVHRHRGLAGGDHTVSRVRGAG